MLCGCASLGGLEKPEVSLVDVRLGELKLLETAGAATIRLDNENAEPLHVEGLVCKLYVDGKRIGKGLSDARFEIPRLGTIAQEVALHRDNLALIRRVRPIIESQRFAYRLQCKVHVRLDGRLRRISVTKEGYLDRSDFVAPGG